jgi:ABC-type glycerol-3-phosphate transport system substrate-binding protein
LEYWTFLDPKTGEARGLAQEIMINDFISSHPDVEVELTNVHWSKIVDRLIMAYAANKGPDIAYVFSPRMPMVIEAGAAIP